MIFAAIFAVLMGALVWGLSALKHLLRPKTRIETFGGPMPLINLETLPPEEAHAHLMKIKREIIWAQRRRNVRRFLRLEP